MAPADNIRDTAPTVTREKMKCGNYGWPGHKDSMCFDRTRKASKESKKGFLSSASILNMLNFLEIILLLLYYLGRSTVDGSFLDFCGTLWFVNGIRKTNPDCGHKAVW